MSEESASAEVAGAEGVGPDGAADVMTLGPAPSVGVGLLIRRPPEDVFEALADPAIPPDLPPPGRLT